MVAVPPRPALSPGFLESSRIRIGAWLRWCGPGRIALILAGTVVTLVGGLWLTLTPDPSSLGEKAKAEARGYAAVAPTEYTLMLPPERQLTPPDTAEHVVGEQIVFVHVVGAVHQPGVYALVVTSRVIDAVQAAGGPTDAAQVEAMNLAALVTDGQRLVVPTAVDVRAGSYQRPDGPAPAGVGTPTTNAVTGTMGDTRININSAGPGELSALPGVGPTIAAAIIEDRNMRGPFASVDDLLRVRGIGPAKLEALRSRARI